MKNIGKVTLFAPIAVFVALAASLYFSATFWTIDYFRGRNGIDGYANELVLRALTVGVMIGLFFSAFWLIKIGSSLVRSSGKADWVSRIFAFSIVPFLALLAWNVLGDFAAVLVYYSQLGMLAMVAFASATKQVLIDE